MGINGKVLVIGGGIGGLALARALVARGMDAEVFEQAPLLSPLGAGLILHPGALLALRQLGLEAAVIRAGTELVRGAALTSSGAVLQETPLALLRDQVGAGTAGIHRARLQQVLLEGLDPIRLGRVFTRYDEDESGVTASFADGSTARGTLLVGADGLRSRVRAQLLGEQPLRYAGYTSWRGVAAGDDFFPPQELSEIWGPGERFGIVPIGHGETYWFAVANAPEGERDDEPLAEVKRRFAGWSKPIARLLDATSRERVLRTDIHDRTPVSSWSRGAVTLLGDAAHPMTPNLGQGACMAIEDAVVLARCLAEHQSSSQALPAYEALRVPRTSRFVKESWQFGRLAKLENPALVWLRNLMLRATPKSIVTKQLVANASVEL
jgi:2-polyprenyl-6-methoxyphenol hydroxylase-like FAD-dependent oxidoreductase